MAEVNGKLVTCDRCSASVFLKCTGEDERDGGFTRWNKFEPLPEGWGTVEIPAKTDASKRTYIKVCPACHNLWYRAINENFLRGSDLYQIEIKEVGEA